MSISADFSLDQVDLLNIKQDKKKTYRTKSTGHYILGKSLIFLSINILSREIHWRRNIWKSETGNTHPHWRKSKKERLIKQVAVKILEKDRIVEIADVERVAREIHILKMMRHPHIIQLYEVISINNELNR
jgi:serine/threonine protein kinase